MAKLCSKATFYRYISELKKEGIIQVMEINNEAFLISQETILDRNIYK
jgi:Fe2+ or Zn2+ uptake regulation protein